MEYDIERVKIRKKVFYGGYDRMGSLNVWSSKDWKAKKIDSTWFFQQTEDFPSDAREAIRWLESGGAFDEIG